MIGRLHCGVCREVVKYREYVYLDFMNTVLHKKCYYPGCEVVDQGTFREIVNKYSFFNTLRIDHLLIEK